MARKKKTVLQGPMIYIPRSANAQVFPQAFPMEKPKHWLLEIFKEKPRTRWEWWREFFVGCAIGWIVSRWFWSSARKRRQVYLDHLGR